jgi:methyl-accepting chemotaxis protein
MTLKQKLLVLFLSVGLLPTLVVGIFSLNVASDSLTQQAYNQLTSIRAIKESQIHNYFEERHSDMKVLEQNVKKLITATNSDQLFTQAHQLQDYFSNFIQAYDYYDLFIIDSYGQIGYTVTKESDYQTNLNTGPFSDSGLGKLYRKVLGDRQYHLYDFSPYAPSNGEPAAFIALPITLNGMQVTLALQLSIEKIDAIMQQRQGMGETGESYLVGADFRMRSNSYLDPAGHSVKASFKGTIKHNGVDTEAVREGLKGETSTKIIIDYNGNPVLSAYTLIDIGDVQWVLLAEIDEAEAMAPVYALKKGMLILLLITVVAVVFIAIAVVKSITRPLGGEPKDMREISEYIASGDLTYQFEENNTTGVYAAMQRMTHNLANIMRQIVDASGQLSATSQQTSATSEQANISLQQQQSNVANVSSAMLEISATVQDVASNARAVSNATNAAFELSFDAKAKVDHTVEVIKALGEEVNEASQVINKMESQSQEIGSVLEVIRGIADQTNLLALNAAIEAARAGEQGRGFAVVADEVRQLAQKTQESTSHIEDMIGVLQQGTKEAVNVMQGSADIASQTVESAVQTANVIQENVKQIEDISARVEQIATAADQQSHATEEVSQSLVHINDAAEQNAVGAEQTAAASSQLSALAIELNQITNKFKVA